MMMEENLKIDIGYTEAEQTEIDKVSDIIASLPLTAQQNQNLIKAAVTMLNVSRVQTFAKGFGAGVSFIRDIECQSKA